LVIDVTDVDDEEGKDVKVVALMTMKLMM